MDKQYKLIRLSHGYFRGGGVHPLPEVLPTIDAHIANWHILIGEKEMNCKKVGDLSGGKYDKMLECNKRVYSTEYCSPTITTCGGGEYRSENFRRTYCA